MDSINSSGEEQFITTDNPPPKDIANRILSSRSSSEGERKQVTVLFADVAGFTSLSEELDPEEVRDLIEPCLDIMTQGVQAYEGTVVQFTGDGIMALFGAPLAFEDAPVRAVRAAIEMRERLSAYSAELSSKGISFEVRIGLNTGLVVVGSMGSDQAVEYTAIGDTVNFASRMESAALPGTVLVSENTYRLAQGFFEFEPLGELEIKGKKKPVRAYRVLAPKEAKTRMEASLPSGLSPFVGRSDELSPLRECFEKARTGEGQVVGIVGEPGIGKSRLLRQFRELLPEGEYTYLEGGCIHYGEAIAYLPILGILRSYFDIQEGEDEVESKQKMDQRLAFLNGQLAHILPPLQELLSLEVDDQTYLSLEPVQRRERVFEAIRYLFMSESQKRPLIMAIEDLHWIDKTTEEFLSTFIEGMPGANILLLLLYRQEYTPAWVSKTFYSQIRVDHLPEKSSIELVEAILSEGEVSTEISDFIVGKTAGNPLFIEELARGLLEAGSIIKDNGHYIFSMTSSGIQVPDTIQGIIASRLDRLSEELKETMQVTSVIGREFSLRLLEAVAGISKPLKSYLMQLQSMEFIYNKTLFPDPEYIFKHALTQEVAYNSLLLKRRKEIHGRIGQAIERLYPDTLADFYETLAYHYSHSDDTEKTIYYLRLSGGKSAKNYANREAVRFYKGAIQTLADLPETGEMKREKLEIYLSIFDPLQNLSFPDGSLEIFEDTEKLAEELKDNTSLAAVYSKLTVYHSFKGDANLGVRYSEKCIDVAERMGDVESMATIASGISVGMIMTGRFLETTAMTRRVLELIEEQGIEGGLFAGGRNVFAHQCGWCGLALGILGELDEGKAMLDKGLKIALEVDDGFGVGWLAFHHSFLFYCMGDISGTIGYARKAIERFEETGVVTILGVALSVLGAGCSFTGDNEEARAYAEKGLEIQKQSGAPAIAPLASYFLALVRSATGDLEGGMECAREGLRLAQGSGTKAWEMLDLLALGRITGAADRERVKLTEDYIRQGILMSEEMKARTFSSQGYLFLGEVFEIAGRREEALENLSKAEGMYQEMGVEPNSYWLTRTQEAITRLESAS